MRHIFAADFQQKTGFSTASTDTYQSCNHRYRFRCAHGHEWDAVGDSLFHGSWCPKCANVLASITQYAPDALLKLQQNLHQQMNMIDLHIQLHHFTAQLLTKRHHTLVSLLAHRTLQHPESVLRHPNHVVLTMPDHMRCSYKPAHARFLSRTLWGQRLEGILATLNDCTRARKCNLVPYKAQGAGNLIGQRGKSNIEAANNGGCCGGQTGHHLIPEASIKPACPHYDHDVAPTVCAEGTSQNMGSHKRVHKALADEHQELAKDGKISPDGSMSMSDALDAATESHAKAFPLSRCSKKCIRAQLEAYYGSACRGARPKMVNDQAKPTLPGNGPL